MGTDKIARRSFLQTSLAGAAGSAVPTAASANAASAAAPNSDALRVGTADYAVQMDDRGSITGITFRDKALVPPIPYGFFEMDGEPVEAAYSPGGEDLTFGTRTRTSAGTIRVTAEDDIRFHLEPENKDSVKEAGLVVTFPVETVFHLAASRNVGQMLDKEMPPGQSHRATLTYNFFLAEWNGMWIRFRVDERKWLSRGRCQAVRHPEMFTVTFNWRADSDARLAVFSSLDEALAEHQQWLETECGLRKLKARRDVPDWVHDIKMVITADMMRSNWEIAHDYADLMDLAKELKEIRDPKEILLYVPGWQGAYDSTHPTYRPHPALGGERKFKEMMDYLHQQGFRLMIHATIYGIDPYHPDIDRLQKLALKDEDGDFKGWQLNDKFGTGPERETLKYRTPPVALEAPAGSSSFSFHTVKVPARCEALLTIGGMKGTDARIRLTVGRRTVSTPPGWFERHDEYDFPFVLLLEPGKNKVEVRVTGGGRVDWSKSWYRIRHAFVPKDPPGVWTHPILAGDTSNPEYIELFTESLDSVTREFAIDAVHVDAGVFHRPTEAKECYLRLREKLPLSTVVCGEWTMNYEEVDYWVFCQGARVSMAPGPESDESDAWLRKPSPVCRFVKDYLRVYPHLCRADAFVPVGKVCNISPPQLYPEKNEELWRVLRDARSLDYLPGLRVNYREYGLDADTKRAIAEL